MAYTVTDPDRTLSPFTGMARRHWIDAGQFLLEGVFGHVPAFDDPIRLQGPEGRTYPKPDDPAFKHRAREFEGLARTFMIAAPLVADRPDVEAGGYGLRDYYANQILLASDPSHPNYLGTITQWLEETGTPLYQHTAEGAALALGLWWSKDVIWDRYSKAERDQVARLLHDYTHHRTNAHNWRSFNVTMGTFLKLTGYDVDDALLRDHLENLLAYYAGDGWYRDLGSYDYYSCWAFQFYLPIWAEMYGYDHEPEMASIIERRHARLAETYPLMFGRDGKSLMWGRSIIYRCAASAAIASAFCLKETPLDPGWARRIASGNLLQFIARDDVFVEGIPSLGFYRTFDPLVQGYSCAASPFWLAKIYLAMTHAADSPFWTATETEGAWPEIGQGQRTVSLSGPGLTITAHGPTGATELRPGKVPGKSNPNYTRLAYHTEFLWEDDAPEGATAMAYSLREYLPQIQEFNAHQDLRYGGMEGGVLYRHGQLRGWMARMDYADIPVPGGVLRVDRPRIPQCHELHLAHYGMPHVGGKAPTVERRDVDGYPVLLGAIPGRQIALVAYSGWDALETMVHEERNAEATTSTVLYARRVRERDFSPIELLVTLMLHKTDDAPWTDEALQPVATLEPVPWTASGQPHGLVVTLKDGSTYTIDWGNIEARTVV